jgi:hypothetical protein
MLRETAFGLAFDPMAARTPAVPLRDAGNYITKLPSAEHATAECQAAMEALIAVAKNGWSNDVCTHRRHAGVKP